MLRQSVYRSDSLSKRRCNLLAERIIQIFYVSEKPDNRRNIFARYFSRFSIFFIVNAHMDISRKNMLLPAYLKTTGNPIAFDKI